MIIAEEAYDFIIQQEVTSPAYYERHYRRPEWPGAASGVTIGCGYDLGYASPEKIRADWQGLVSTDVMHAMLSCSGVKGLEARELLPTVKYQIDVPWSAAEQVFRKRDVPQWTGAVQRALQNTDKISALCLGMHVATAYNRGIGGYHSNAPRFSEMRAIANEMSSGDFRSIGGEFLSMRRLWPTLRGLRDRYTETSRLWDRGMMMPVGVDAKHPPVQHDGEDPLHAGPARTKPPTSTKTQNATTGAAVGGAVAAAHHAAASGLSTWHVLLILVAGLVVAGTVWYAWHKNRNPT